MFCSYSHISNYRKRMIKLSDYLDYLSSEIVNARVKADLKAIETAKEYSKHEYLRYFRAPYFSMPTVKMEIPIKVTNIDTEVKANSASSKEQILKRLNHYISIENRDSGSKIPSFTEEMLNSPKLDSLIENYIQAFDNNSKESSSLKTFSDSPANEYFEEIVSIDQISFGKISKRDLNKTYQLFLKSLNDEFNKVAVKLNDIYIDPNTKESISENKMLIKLSVEMVEEGLKIMNVKNEKGQEFEEIILE